MNISDVLSNWTYSNRSLAMNITCFLDSEAYLAPYFRWLVPILVIAGVVGNGFILIVFNSKGMRTKTHFILSAMAAVDLAHSVVAMLTNIYLYEWTINSDTFSRIYHHRMKPPLMVIINWLAMTSTWLAVLCTIERYIAIRHPLKAHLIIRKRPIVLATLAIAILSLLVVSYYAFWFRRLTVPSCENPRRMLYRLIPDIKLWMYGHASRQIHSLLATVVPIVLLFYYNGSLVYYLRRNRNPHLHKVNDNRRRAKRHGSSGGQGQKTAVVSFEDAREQKVASVVLSITLTTACLLLPSALVVVYDVIRYVDTCITGRTAVTPWWYMTVCDFSNTLVLLEKVLDFFLYCFASGSFRRRLMAMCFGRARPTSFLSSHRRWPSTSTQNRPHGITHGDGWVHALKYRSLSRGDHNLDSNQTTVSLETGLPRSKVSVSISECSTDTKMAIQRQLAMETILQARSNSRNTSV